MLINIRGCFLGYFLKQLRIRFQRFLKSFVLCCCANEATKRVEFDLIYCILELSRHFPPSEIDLPFLGAFLRNPGCGDRSDCCHNEECSDRECAGYCGHAEPRNELVNEYEVASDTIV